MYVRRFQGKSDVFIGMEHRLRKEEMEEQFNKEAKEGWRFAADERADRKHIRRNFCGNRQQPGSSCGSSRRGVDPR